MKKIVETENGAWCEIETTDEAYFISRATNTGMIYSWGNEDDRKKAGEEYQRYYVFLTNDGQAPIIFRKGLDGQEMGKNVSEGDFLVGYCGRNPLPQYKDDIDSLGDAMGIDIGPDKYWYDLDGDIETRTSLPWIANLSSDEAAAILATAQIGTLSNRTGDTYKKFFDPLFDRDDLSPEAQILSSQLIDDIENDRREKEFSLKLSKQVFDWVKRMKLVDVNSTDDPKWRGYCKSMQNIGERICVKILKDRAVEPTLSLKM